MNAVSDPLVKEGESFQPVHLLANEMLNVFFALKEDEVIVDEETGDVE
jgi:hypothetical protein